MDRSSSPVGRAEPTVAATARSILSCPATADLVVDDLDHALAGVGDLGMRDDGGRPTFHIPPGTLLAEAARHRRRALLVVDSGLGAPGSVDRTAVLTISGRFTPLGAEDCECCGDHHLVARLEPDLVLLGRRDGGRSGSRPGRPTGNVRVPLDDYASDVHVLNRGFLELSQAHANACHQDELRQAVAMGTGTRPDDVAGVALCGLTPWQVEIRWVAPDGAHAQSIRFPRPAATPADLGAMLRQQLHAGIC